MADMTFSSTAEFDKPEEKERGEQDSSNCDGYGRADESSSNAADAMFMSLRSGKRKCAASAVSIIAACFTPVRGGIDHRRLRGALVK